MGQKKFDSLKLFRTYFLNNSKYMRNNITRDIQSTEAAPKYSHILMEYNTLYPPAFFLHYDMKVE